MERALCKSGFLVFSLTRWKLHQPEKREWGSPDHRSPNSNVSHKCLDYKNKGLRIGHQYQISMGQIPNTPTHQLITYQAQSPTSQSPAVTVVTRLGL